MKKLKFIFVAVMSLLSVAGYAQERVYVSTDKECYVAGEDLWYSLYCKDEASGGYSHLSDVAYLQFVSSDGVAALHKGALIGGRGCGRFQIPLDLPTGNYMIVAYTAHYGGESAGEYNGKVISVFNTLTAAKVKDGVVQLDEAPAVKGEAQADRHLVVETGKGNGRAVPVKVCNTSDGPVSVNISVYHNDELTKLSGRYNGLSLLQRGGEFQKVDDVEYTGEVVDVKVQGRKGESAAGKYVFMSGIGNTDDVYMAKVGEDGVARLFTGNVMGRRDLVFEVVGDTSVAYNIEILQNRYGCSVSQIPVLGLGEKMNKALKERGRRMQISRMFVPDTLFDMGKVKDKMFEGNTSRLVYNLDDYTRFQNLEETLREYVKYARVRKNDVESEIKVIWEENGRPLVLLDGVPVNDHSIVLSLDQHLVKQIAVYPVRYMLNHFMYDGIVSFVTYKGDMGGVKLPKNMSVVGFDGVSWPLAILGGKKESWKGHPNFMSTIYWNPIVEIPAGGEFEFNCTLPQYKGDFKIVVEGIDAAWNEVCGAGGFVVE